MVDSIGSANPHRGVSLAEELDSDQQLWWTGVRAILSANEAETRAIEGYLHLMRDDFEGSLEARDVDTLIDAAIQNHERAVEDLRLAKRSVEALDGN